jgi:pseudouridine-5'-phosphate glycosidase
VSPRTFWPAPALAHSLIRCLSPAASAACTAETSFDISADRQELARTSVAVVCVGAKSILDIGLTLEYPETHGVPVISVGQDNFAAFYTSDSGFKADFRLDTPAE